MVSPLESTLAKPATSTQQALRLSVAWLVMLAVSNLPTILLRELAGSMPAWMLGARLAVLAGALLITSLWRELRPVRAYVLLSLAVIALSEGVAYAANLLPMREVLAANNNTFLTMVGTQQVQRLAVGLLMLAASALVLHQRRAFYWQVGNSAAPAGPLKFVGVMGTSTWKRRGPLILLATAGGVVAFILLAGGSASLSNLLRALPLLPFVLLFAAINAFGEEITYRAPQLGALEPALGPTQSLLLTSIYFGLAHFYGVPYGVIGVLMASAIGWLLGKSMLETRGFLWAWLIHVGLDMVIFTIMAAGSLPPR
jgi:membrane protease YdiL (CAAX protease family)